MLHSCSIPFEEGGSANGVLITDKSRGPGGDDESVLSKPLGREHFIRNEAGTLSGQRLIRGVCGSFCVALRSEPSNLAVAAHPIVNVSFTRKAADNPNFRARDTGFNLPVGSVIRLGWNTTRGDLLMPQICPHTVPIHRHPTRVDTGLFRLSVASFDLGSGRIWLLQRFRSFLVLV